MTLNQIYQIKHELWLKFLFVSFAISDDESLQGQKIKDELYDFANIQFRHLKWLSNECKEKNIEYFYEKSEIEIQKFTNFEYFQYLINEIKISMRHYQGLNLFARIISDEFYMIQKLELFLSDRQNDRQITAFNKKRIYEKKQLSVASIEAFTLLLHEETYKEYELILIYSYIQNYTDDIKQYNLCQDLIGELQYHLKKFGNMMAKMGILTLPDMLKDSAYKIDDTKKFLKDSVEKEKKSKEECMRLIRAIDDDELSQFFDFITFQEDYHIKLIQKITKE